MINSNLNSIKSDPRIHSKTFRLSDYKTILSGKALDKKIHTKFKFTWIIAVKSTKTGDKSDTKLELRNMYNDNAGDFVHHIWMHRPILARESDDGR